MEAIKAKVLALLKEKPGYAATIATLVSELNIDQSLIMASAQDLSAKELITIKEEHYQEISPGKEWNELLPERKALAKVGENLSTTGEVELSRLPEILNKPDVRSEVKWFLRRGWFERSQNLLRLLEKGKRALAGELDPDEKIVLKLKKASLITSLDLKKELPDVDIERCITLLREREKENIIRIRQRTVRTIVLTPKGQQSLADSRQPIADSQQPTVTQITPELLTSGKWRSVRFRPYDITLPTKPKFPGKAHPLTRIVQEARRAFLEMGFEEVTSPIVETAFWDFDALFQPQDHPAREMQDTFYLPDSVKGKLPDKEIIERVALTHENGWQTGSQGWGYHWDQTKAERLLLRTHTTAATIRALAQNPNPPRKVFCIGKVFRRENMDATHLPEFIQIDGIIIDENSSLVTLFGTLTEFYRKMGAKEVRFRPSYFPYTEPSVEVFANLGELGWVEMGGAGVFRQEVVQPFGCKTRVLAWGLGLERLAMMRFKVQDIRKLYWADINWLRKEATLRC
ncbi:MAG: phenylalanine--tRNA ligase subunit alpha [candidate division WOR-3 bacterium]